MSVGTFDPRAPNTSKGAPIDAALVERACAIAANVTDEVTLTPAETEEFAVLATSSSWVDVVGNLSEQQLEALIRLFTLGEMQFSSWNGGARSPVIVFVKTLKARSAYPADLTRWIKAHTTNKFLPHGNLMDRL